LSAALAVLTIRPTCHPYLVSCLLSLEESLPSVPYVYEYPVAVAVSDVPGSGSRVHTNDHGGSKAHDELSDSIGKHRPPLPQSILSSGELSYPP
ncbi:hypothetical protein Tco_0221001, partial [Tanacetum coccineum]